MEDELDVKLIKLKTEKLQAATKYSASMEDQKIWWHKVEHDYWEKQWLYLAIGMWSTEDQLDVRCMFLCQ